MWAAVACGAASAFGYAAAGLIPGIEGGAAAALAIGGVLAMLTDSPTPLSSERGGDLAGVWTVVGFCAALMMGQGRIAWPSLPP